jgi:hypothetical protein
MALSGKEYADLVASYILKNFGARGLTVYREVSMGKTIIGKNRHVDILVLREATSTVLAIECKYQDTLGTVDEKIPYAIQDMQAMGVPVCLAYAGSGFSSGILHMLAACPIAAQCLPGPALEPSRETREMDIALAMAFSFWDLVVAHKKPFALPQTEPLAVPQAAATQAAPLALPPAEPPPKQLAEVVSIGPLFGARDK